MTVEKAELTEVFKFMLQTVCYVACMCARVCVCGGGGGMCTGWMFSAFEFYVTLSDTTYESLSWCSFFECWGWKYSAVKMYAVHELTKQPVAGLIVNSLCKNTVMEYVHI
jgi:hypothetical protein